MVLLIFIKRNGARALPRDGGILNLILGYVFISMFGFVGVFYVTLEIHSTSFIIVSAYFYAKVGDVKPVNGQ
jgi:O-antigen/teichoic acid export membrane protein